uniref:Uncharacterized protein n=1 Tax=Chromera velia CCMP2878 TaxID=1169474 RepID=A0A0G4HZK4_9ALVE|eukprot:Cvel_1589.t1-p1 / transcript=Cvel_1589.t1 / gene=Cvel_1589 / organism=Chromera_velia_CCMP2878 / gene_product=hypothetical protein / transcript_product=hypothetical protein / location=Cvel_scaffold56:140411-152233(+) / protein_length=481 / sequence_SO=supercontig / SO=protein_coding / is_pseudo=false
MILIAKNTDIDAYKKNQQKRRELGLGKQPCFLTSIIQQLAKAGSLPPHLILENVLDWKNRKFSLETEDVDGDLITIIDETNLELIKCFPVRADQLLAKVRARPQKYGLIPSPEASDLHPSFVSISDPAPAPIQAAPPGNGAGAYTNGPDANGHIAAAAAVVEVVPVGGLAEPSNANGNGLRSAESRASRGSMSSSLRDVDVVAHIEQSNNGHGGYDLRFDDDSEDDSESEFLSDTPQVRRDVQPLIITGALLSVYLQARIEARSGEVVAFCRDALEILEVADKNAHAFQDLPGFEAAHMDAVVPAILLRQFRAQSEREEDASAQQGKEKQRPGPDTTKATHAHSAQYNAHPPAGSHSQPPSNSQCGHSMAPEEAASKNTAEEAELEYRKILNLFSDIQKIVKTKNKVIVIGGLKVVDEKQDPNEYAPFEKTETEKDIEEARDKLERVMEEAVEDFVKAVRRGWAGHLSMNDCVMRASLLSC